jgi:hypothetical protein
MGRSLLADFGLPWFLLLPTGVITMIVFHRFLSKPTERHLA